jgi:uncharacterized protein YdaU (DUF1376 family)
MGKNTKGKEIQMHYFKRNIGDYHKKAGRLSIIEHGAYTLLMDSCYDRERFPTLEEAIEWCWARSPEEIAAIEFVLSKFFTLTDGLYVQLRIEEEIAAYQAMSINNKRIAAEREDKRRLKKHGSSTERTRSVNEAPPNQEPLTINQEPLTKNQEPRTTNDKVKTIVPSDDDTSASDDAMSVFNYWKIATGKSKAKLNSTIRGKILPRLKAYSVSDLLSAIDGNQASRFHQGDNDQKRKYDSLDLICRNDENVRKFMEMADHQNTVNRDLEDWVNE